VGRLPYPYAEPDQHLSSRTKASLKALSYSNPSGHNAAYGGMLYSGWVMRFRDSE